MRYAFKDPWTEDIAKRHFFNRSKRRRERRAAEQQMHFAQRQESRAADAHSRSTQYHDRTIGSAAILAGLATGNFTGGAVPPRQVPGPGAPQYETQTGTRSVSRMDERGNMVYDDAPYSRQVQTGTTPGGMVDNPAYAQWKAQQRNMGLSPTSMAPKGGWLGQFTRNQKETQTLYNQMSDDLIRQMGLAQQGTDANFANAASLAQQSQAFYDRAMNFNSAGYRDHLASQAADDAALAFNTTRDMQRRRAAAMGRSFNPGSFDASLAAARAGAMNRTRWQADMEGWRRHGEALSARQAALGQAGSLNRMGAGGPDGGAAAGDGAAARPDLRQRPELRGRAGRGQLPRAGGRAGGRGPVRRPRGRRRHERRHGGAGERIEGGGEQVERMGQLPEVRPVDRRHHRHGQGREQHGEEELMKWDP